MGHETKDGGICTLIIETKEDWWYLVDKHWADLYRILDMYLPLSEHENLNKEIIEETLGCFITTLKEKKDEELVRYFHSAWWRAPDCPSIHKIPSWGILCDLCSENWVFQEEKQ